MAGARGFATSSKLIDAVCSIPAFSAAARQAGQASTSSAHSCSTRLLGLPLAGSQSRHLSSSCSPPSHGLPSGPLREYLQLPQLPGFADCRRLHTLSRLNSPLHNSRDLPDSPEAAGRREQPHDLLQKRTAFGLPNLNGDSSKKYTERRLIGYSQEQLYTVVAGVEHYKEFVPWCQKSEIIITKPPGFVEAELEVGFKMFVERYTSQVHLNPPARVISKVYDSTLFDHLDSTWDFKPGPTPQSTWLSFTVDFAFKSPLYHHIATVFFDEVVKRMMGAFEERCRQLYGTSAFQKPQQQKQKLQTA